MNGQIQRGIAAFIMVVTGLLASLPVLKTLPAMSVIFGIMGSYLVALAIEDEVTRHIHERAKNQEMEMRNMIIEWPGARVSHLSPETPTLWALLRPIILEDLLWRNNGMIPQPIRN